MGGGVSIVEWVGARAVEGGWCRPPSRVFAYNNFPRNTTTVLLSVFSDGAREPSVVAKLCRNMDRVRQEFANLQTVRRVAPAVAPQPLFVDRVEGFGVLGMEAVLGTGVFGWVDSLHRVPAAVETLVRLHGALAGAAPRDGDPYRCVRDAVGFLQRHTRDARAGTRAARIGEEILPAAAEGLLPPIPQHGDFYFGNMLFRGEEVSVIDWEDFGAVCVPGYDLFSLFLSFFTPWRPAEVEWFFGNAQLAEKFRKGVRDYFRALGIPLELAGGLLGFTVIQQFAYSERVGSSNAQALWQRLQAYLDNAERFARLLEGL